MNKFLNVYYMFHLILKLHPSKTCMHTNKIWDIAMGDEAAAAKQQFILSLHILLCD